MRSPRLRQKRRFDGILARFALTSASCEQIDVRYAGIFIVATSVKRCRIDESFGVTAATFEATSAIAVVTFTIGAIDNS